MSVDMVVFYFRRVWIASFLFLFSASLLLLRGADSAIVLGPIEGELAKKQIPIDLGRTPKVLVPLISKPIFVHGGLRLASEKDSRFRPPLVQLEEWYTGRDYTRKPQVSL